MSLKVCLEVELKRSRDMEHRIQMVWVGPWEFNSLVNDNNINSVNNYK